MNLKCRLGRLEQRRPPPGEPEDKRPDSARWLEVLEMLAGLAPDDLAEDVPLARDRDLLTASAREAAPLLQTYALAGQVGAHVEYHCGAALLIFADWWHGLSEPAGPQHGRPPPTADEAARLREALQIDAWHRGQ